MAAMGYEQCAVAHPEKREQYLMLMERAIKKMLSPRVRQFDMERWQSDPMKSLDTDEGHAAYLGDMNLAMSFHHLLVPDSSFTGLNDRVSAALRGRMENSPYGTGGAVRRLTKP